MLVSPHFLFRMEPDPAPTAPERIRALNDYEVATRLSYFLWSSMPDDELFALAAAGAEAGAMSVAASSRATACCRSTRRWVGSP